LTAPLSLYQPGGPLNSRTVNKYIIIESSHLFRAGEKFGTQFFVIDIASYLSREVYKFEEPFQTIVLFGSTKEDQAIRYIRSLTKNGIEVIRMNPVDSRVEEGKKFYKPTLYLHRIFHEIPPGSEVVLIGFHNHRYTEILEKYAESYKIHAAAFTTKTSKGEWMFIPEEWADLTVSCLNLDSCVEYFKEEYHKQKAADQGK
jgi:hypothetical protein